MSPEPGRMRCERAMDAAHQHTQTVTCWEITTAERTLAFATPPEATTPVPADSPGSASVTDTSGQHPVTVSGVRRGRNGNPD